MIQHGLERLLSTMLFGLQVPGIFFGGKAPFVEIVLREYLFPSGPGESPSVI